VDFFGARAFWGGVLGELAGSIWAQGHKCINTISVALSLLHMTLWHSVMYVFVLLRDDLPLFPFSRSGLPNRLYTDMYHKLIRGVMCLESGQAWYVIALPSVCDQCPRGFD
jgi:hypothetical protein